MTHKQSGVDPGSVVPLDVLLIGAYFCDLIFTGLPHMPVLGQEIFGSNFDMLPGGTFNMALALHQLGVNVAWKCEFGDDFFSQFVLDAARQAHLDERFFQVRDTPLRNLSVSLSFAQDRAFVTYADQFRPAELIDSLPPSPIRCVAIPVLYYQPDLIPLGRQLHERGSLLFMDCAQTDVTLETPDVVDALQMVDVFAPNDTEALAITGESSVSDALAVLASLTSLVVVKQGAKGAVARRGSQEIAIPALSGLQVVDTTGAGDCFNAGFLCGYLRGEPLETCLQLGNIVGGLSTRARGIRAVPTLAEAERYLATYPTPPPGE